MGIFGFFRKPTPASGEEPDLFLLQGPAYLRNHLQPLSAELSGKIRIKHPDIEWVGQLVSSSGNKEFELYYFGDLLDNKYIIGKEDKPQRLMAIDVTTREEILLFDKALHGWAGFVIDDYAAQKTISRSVDKRYRSSGGKDLFRIVVKAFYNHGTRQELLEARDEEGKVVMEDGRKLEWQQAFDDAFDYFVIYVIDENEQWVEVVNEELA